MGTKGLSNAGEPPSARVPYRVTPTTIILASLSLMLVWFVGSWASVGAFLVLLRWALFIGNFSEGSARFWGVFCWTDYPLALLTMGPRVGQMFYLCRTFYRACQHHRGRGQLRCCFRALVRAGSVYFYGCHCGGRPPGVQSGGWNQWTPTFLLGTLFSYPLGFTTRLGPVCDLGIYGTIFQRFQ